MASFFTDKPAQAPDRRVIYFLPPGGSVAMPQGPFSTKELHQRAQSRDICGLTWVFVEGDKEWRQVRNVKVLNDMLPAIPADIPSQPAAENEAPTSGSNYSYAESQAAAGAAPPDGKSQTSPSIRIDLGMGSPAEANSVDSVLPEESAPTLALDLSKISDEPHVEQEEVTMAMDTLGLNLHMEGMMPPPAPPSINKVGVAPMPPASAPPAKPPPFTPPAASPPPIPPPLAVASDDEKPKPLETEGFDGIVAEIPTDPIWLVKQASSDTVSGPFKFLDVVKFLEQGKLTKNDKISRAGTKSFVKIVQQYEFNVKFSLETVIENGVEKQKIFIRRRHPRVPYITGVQVVSKHGLQAGDCMNISAGGILMDVPKAEFNLGEIIEIKILPGLIAKAISCKALIIGKIPKIPPGYALKFEDLKPNDKEAIEYYVQETLKREMSKKN